MSITPNQLRDLRDHFIQKPETRFKMHTPLFPSDSVAMPRQMRQKFEAPAAFAILERWVKSEESGDFETKEVALTDARDLLASMGAGV